MSVLCLTGWQQPADALKTIAPAAMHFDYDAFDNVEKLFLALPPEPRLAIGWSLGGQLLVRAIAGGHVKPDALMLLGAPFQWVADAEFPGGVGQDVADEVMHNYTANPKRMLTGFHTLIALGDSKEREIISALDATAAVWKNGAYWLGQLAKTSCRALDFTGFPPTTIIHGLKDRVIALDNAQAYGKTLAGAELVLWPDCAHAPHLHNPEDLRGRIAGYV